MNKKTKKILTIVIPVVLVLLIALCIVLILVLPKDKPVVHVESVTLNETTHTLEIGETYQLEADVTPTDADNKTVTWASSSDAVATVSAGGLVTAVAQGNATITVTTTDGEKTATCDITVNPAIIHVESVQLNYSEYTLNVGGNSLELKETVSPANATDKTVTWKSSKEDVAVVSDKGVVTAIAAGTAKITVTTTDGAKTATCDITVNAISVESIALNEKTHSLRLNDEPFTLTAEILPAAASNTTITWTSSDNKVVTVSEQGVVTPKAEGTAIITATAGGKSDTCEVTVNSSIAGTSQVKIDIDNKTVKPGDTFHVKLAVNSSRKDYIWSGFTFSIVPLALNDKGVLTYSKEYAKNFEYVQDSCKTNLPPLTAPTDFMVTNLNRFDVDDASVGVYVDIAFRGLEKPTSESIIIEFDVKVKEDAVAIPSFQFGVAPVRRNVVTYYNETENSTVTDMASGTIEVRVDGTITERITGECFKVDPVEMHLVKDN